MQAADRQWLAQNLAGMALCLRPTRSPPKLPKLVLFARTDHGGAVAENERLE